MAKAPSAHRRFGVRDQGSRTRERQRDEPHSKRSSAQASNAVGDLADRDVDVMALEGTRNPRAMAAGVAHATIPTMAGMTAALEAAKAGYQVSLVEKEEALGGFGAKLKKSTPTKPPDK